MVPGEVRKIIIKGHLSRNFIARHWIFLEINDVKNSVCNFRNYLFIKWQSGNKKTRNSPNRWIRTFIKILLIPQKRERYKKDV